MINFIKDAVTAVSGIKTFLFNTDYRNNFDLQNVEFPCCVLTPIMRTNYDLNNIIRESAELQLSVVDRAPYEYTGDELYAINKRCSDLALQVIANLQVKSKLDKELTFEFILPSGDELISGVMCNLQCTMRQGSCIGAPSYVEIVVQPIKRESITSNGKHVITPSSGFNAMREVEVDVNVELKGNLQDKQVTITENGTTTIVADEGFEGLNSVEVMSEVYEGFDLVKLGLSKDEAITINAEILDAIQRTKNLLTSQNPTSLPNKPLEFVNVSLANVGSLNGRFRLKHIKYLKDFNFEKATDLRSAFEYSVIPLLSDINMPNIKDCGSMFYGATIKAVKNNELTINVGWLKDNNSISSGGPTFQGANFPHLSKFEVIGDRQKQPPSFFVASGVIDNFYYRNSENILTMINFCENGAYIKNVYFGSLAKCTNFTGLLSQFNPSEKFYFEKWKQGNVPFEKSAKIPPENVHYIIQNAVSVVDGATARTLTLHAAAKANWETSEYYQEDLAVLEEKGITIA